MEGQGSCPRIDKAAGEEEVQYDAMGNKVDSKVKKISASDARKVSGCISMICGYWFIFSSLQPQLKKERMARKRRRGEDDGDDD